MDFVPSTGDIWCVLGGWAFGAFILAGHYGATEEQRVHEHISSMNELADATANLQELCYSYTKSGKKLHPSLVRIAEKIATKADWQRSEQERRILAEVIMQTSKSQPTITIEAEAPRY